MELSTELSSLALIAGALIPIQASSNALLAQTTGHVLYSAFILFAIGFFLLLVLILVYRSRAPGLSVLLNAPVQNYLGGFIMAGYVLAITFLVPKIGVGNAVLFIVSGQILSAALIDHFAVFGSALFSLTLQRYLG